MIKYAVFDFDGTIADSKAIFVKLYNELAQQKGYTLMTEQNIELLRKMSITERCRYLKVPVYKIPFIAAGFLRQYRKSVPLLDFCPGMEEVLARLVEKQIPVAVLSSNSRENIDTFFKLKQVEITDIFCSSNIFGKDRVLKKFLCSKQLMPSQILYVGDEARDIIACRKVGVKAVWVTWGYDAEEAVQNTPPDYKVTTPHQLLQLIENLLFT